MQPQTAEWHVNEMLREHRPFKEIEEYINGLTISEEQRSTLWLWAWSELPRIERRGIISLDSC